MAARAVSQLALLVLAVAVCLNPVSAAGDDGSSGQEVELSCTTEFTCGTPMNLAYKADYVPADFSKATATCLCQNGTRVVAVGNYTNPTIKSAEPDGPLAAQGCYANMTWSLAAPFVGACYGGVPTAACTTQCAASLAPFNERCFHSVLNNPFFLIDPNGTLYSEHITSQFYAACFPPVSPPSPPLARPPPTPSSAQGLAWSLAETMAAAVAAVALLLAA